MIPYAKHEISQEDFLSINEVLNSNSLTNGSFVELFESEINKLTGSKYTSVCSSGTSALHLAVMALGIKKGDVVIVPSMTFVATANAVLYAGADVIFADIDETTGLMTAETIEKAIHLFSKSYDVKKIKAIINVHYAGQCENLRNIYDVARKYNLKIIEDAAHAIGTKYIDESGELFKVGANAFSDITTFSFHPTKTITTGEGGAVTTNNPDYATIIKLLRSHGSEKNPDKFCMSNFSYPGYYENQYLGYNYRLCDINCALGCSQIKKIDQFISKRKKLTDMYDEIFKGNEYITPLKKSEFSDAARHLYVIFIDFSKIKRNEFMKTLMQRGAGTQVHYFPVHMHPLYKQKYGEVILKNTENFFSRCLSIPLFTTLSEKEIYAVKDAIISTILED